MRVVIDGCGVVDVRQICLTSLPAVSMSGLECGHRFCRPCWAEYLTTKIMSEGIGTIACAAHGCDVLIDDATVSRLLPEPKVRQKYQHLITNSFVEVSTDPARFALALLDWSAAHIEPISRREDQVHLIRFSSVSMGFY